MRRPIIILSHTDAEYRAEAASVLRDRLDVHVLPIRLLADLPSSREHGELLVIEYPAGRAPHVLNWITRWREQVGCRPVILVASRSTVDDVVLALKCGVNDYLRTPITADQLSSAVRLHMSAAPRIAEPTIVGDAPVICDLREQINRAALSDATALVTGETGTGKELAAEAIHRLGRRARGPFISVNCAAIPNELLESELFGFEKGAFTGAHASHEGKVRLAEGGTLFLDEVGELSPWAQAKLLRLIDKREVWPLGSKHPFRVDSRIVAATNRDLAAMVDERAFRSDLFYRLNVVRIHLPPLRARAEDLPKLLQHYIGTLSSRAADDLEQFDDEALAALMRYHWPGNIRELKNLVESLFVTSPPRRIGVNELPSNIRGALASASAHDDRSRLLRALTSTNWNVSRAARQLNWSRMTIYRKMARYHVVKSHPASYATGLAIG